MRFRYEDLRVGDLVQEYIDVVYRTTENFPKSEQYCLIQQLRRAATSIYLNLAEGSVKQSKKDFARFITISIGSLVETHAIYQIALRRKYISQEIFDILDTKIKNIWIQLCALRDSQRR